MKRSKVGILGGMGPEATILIQQRLLGATVTFDDSDHLPLLIDMNPQVPSRCCQTNSNQSQFTV